jgi:general secretion pathway protein G
MTRERGWTLVEGLTVLAIVGALGTLLVPYLLGRLQTAKLARAMAEIRAIEADLEVYQAEHADLPADLHAVGRGDDRDPWGNPYRYFPFKGNSWKGQARKDRFLVPINSTYDLYSMGRDGDTRRPLTPPPSWDDVLRANDGEYLGLAANY